VLPPEGGPRDETAPRIVREGSTPDLQSNFRPDRIRLEFDEWVQIRDAIKQVVISPPTQKAPQVQAKGKAVEVIFDKEEPWKDSTTYTLFFGKAVSDRSENNVVEDLRFIFATGPQLDSLEAQGQLLDARTRQPLEDILLLLHRSEADSAVSLDLPDYFTRTDNNGRYRFSYLREGTYRVFALEDRNSNYRYDQPEERLGWLEGRIYIGADSLSLPLITLPPAVRRSRVLAVDSTSVRGRISFAFNRKPTELTLPEQEGTFTFTRWTQDSILTLWQKTGCPAGWFLAGSDTLHYPAFSDTIPALNELPKLNRSGKQPPEVPLALVLRPPMDSLDPSRLRITRDTLDLPLKSWQISEGGDTLYLVGITPAESNISLFFLPGALQALSGATNRDTLALGFITGTQGEWASLHLVLDSLPSNEQVLLEITDPQGKARFAPFRSTGEGQWIIDLPPLEPGPYQVYLSLDKNRNGQWDGADFYRGSLSEPRSVHLIPNLRANWELELRLVPDWVKTK
jgi:hypothetical protein